MNHEIFLCLLSTKLLQQTAEVNLQIAGSELKENTTLTTTSFVNIEDKMYEAVFTVRRVS